MTMDFSNIRNLVFDLGGVIIDLDRDESVRRLQAIGLTQADALLDPYKQSGVFLDLETGRMTAPQFLDRVRAMIAENGHAVPSDLEIQDAFNGFLVGLPVERLRALEALRKSGYRLFAISNTNPLMFHSWIESNFRADGKTIRDYFDGIVASFEEGACKPDPLIFNRLMNRYALRPEETLLLDDSPANVEGARRWGLNAVRVGYTPQDDMLHFASLLK